MPTNSRIEHSRRPILRALSGQIAALAATTQLLAGFTTGIVFGSASAAALAAQAHGSAAAAARAAGRTAVSPAPAAKAAAARAAAGAADEKGDEPAAPKRDWSAPVLANLAKEYKASPDELTWGKYFTYLRDMLVAADFAAANPAEIIAANPSLNELHVRVSDSGIKNMHLWSFPSISQSHAVIFAAPGRTTTIPLPLSIALREGRIIPGSYAAPAAVSRVVVKVKGKHGQIVKVVKGVKAAPATAAPALSTFGKFLVLIGGDRQTNTLWFKAYRLGEGPLVEAPELFASLPAFFSQNVTGKAGFSGNDIVLTIQPPAGPQAKEEEKPDMILQADGKSVPAKKVATAVAGYKVMLKYMGGKFGLAGHLPDDAPLGIALAFAQNICAGRPDVAKAWLADPKLVSIPKYLGLVGRTSPPMRLVAMSGASGARYRLVTSAKDDLIIDVGRITTPGKMKGQLAVKGLFVAPPDPYAAKFAGTPVMPQQSEKPDDGESNADSEGAGTKGGAKPAAKASEGGTNASARPARKG